MKSIWKILLAIALIVIVSVWSFDATRPRFYEGSDLNAPTGRGSVTITNSSDTAVPVQLMGTGPRAFSVSSETEGIAGSSTRSGSGRNITHLYDFSLPPGVSNLTVTGGTAVNLLATSTAPLEATIYPLNSDETRLRIIIVAGVILASLFYISATTKHGWMRLLNGGRATRMEAPPTVPAVTKSQPLRAYGDNRIDISER
jgi:hypothetical protein